MKVSLKCSTLINGEKIAAKTTVKNVTMATCLELPDSEARALINRQHARLAVKGEQVNFAFAAKKAEK
jgi:hypothetical protein